MPSMINKEKNIAFLHFQKCGGWWVAETIKEHNFLPINYTKNGGHIGVEDLPEGCNSFGFIRHPVSWYVSMFHFMHTVGWRTMHSFEQLKSNNINEFIINCQEDGIFILGDYFDKFYGIGTDKECKQIFKFENLEQSMNQLADLYDIPIKEDVKKFINRRRNASRKLEQTQDLLNGSSLHFIEQNCQYILERFDYDLLLPQ